VSKYTSWHFAFEAIGTHWVIDIHDPPSELVEPDFLLAIRNRIAEYDKNYIKENEPGLRLKQEKSCPMCDHTEEVSMPLGASFLWPSTAG
jgi:hypothetical protein